MVFAKYLHPKSHFYSNKYGYNDLDFGFCRIKLPTFYVRDTKLIQYFILYPAEMLISQMKKKSFDNFSYECAAGHLKCIPFGPLPWKFPRETLKYYSYLSDDKPISFFFVTRYFQSYLSLLYDSFYRIDFQKEIIFNEYKLGLHLFSEKKQKDVFSVNELLFLECLFCRLLITNIENLANILEIYFSKFLPSLYAGNREATLESFFSDFFPLLSLDKFFAGKSIFQPINTHDYKLYIHLHDFIYGGLPIDSTFFSIKHCGHMQKIFYNKYFYNFYNLE